jgi:hypothetical protein
MGRKPRKIKLRRIYRDGKIYIPSSTRKHFKGCPSEDVEDKFDKYLDSIGL